METSEKNENKIKNNPSLLFEFFATAAQIISIRESVVAYKVQSTTEIALRERYKLNIGFPMRLVQRNLSFVGETSELSGICDTFSFLVHMRNFETHQINYRNPG